MAEEENKPAQPPQPQEAPPAQSASGAPSTPSTPQTAPQRQPELGLIGQEISGCVILEKVSEGGMGTVFKAKHKALDRIVCVKILSPALSNDKKAVGLFLTEARAIAEIDHPNIVFVYNVGREKGFYFIVMSFIEGESLSSIVRKKPNLPLSFIVDTFIGILRGLEAAHQKGIIHRDIKPSNILINRKLEPKIVDFGIAKKVDKDKGNTKTTELAGTAYFLSPEQAMGRAIDTRADLYSVGASMFYVLTGKYPFTGKNSMDIIQKHINEPVPDVAQYRRGLPPWIPAAINKLMSKNPDDRFQTATQTLMYFQKMRADDQLKVTSSGVNIADEVGLKISNVEMGGPAAPKTADISDAHTTQSNRFNMNIAPRTDRANRSSIPIMSLGSAAPKDIPNHRQTAEPRPQLRPEKVVTDNVPPPNKRKFAASRHTGEGFFKRHQHLVKSFFTMALALLMMLGANFLLFKLGVLCSQYDIAGKSFFNALITPWVSGDFLPGQTPLGAVCFIFLAFTATMYFFGSISKIVPVTLVIAALAYLGGFFGWEKPFPDGGFSAFTYLPMYAFIFGALGINIDENDSFHFVYRFSCLVFFALAFYCIYLFTAPQEFVKGELTASLFYSTIGLTAAALVLPFIRGGRIFRLAAVLLFVSCCASIWVYQTSGNVYKLMQEINLSAARAEQQAPAPAPPQEEEPQAKYTLEIQNFSYTQGFYADPRREAAFAAENLRPEQIKEESAPQQEQPAVEAPLLTPGQKRALFISNINASAAQLTPAQAQRLVWVFALQEPVEKFKHDYKREGFARFTIIALTIYGALMFIIFLLGSREERWNLI